MTDIVIPFRHSINADEELRYTLRGIERFLPDAGEVFILGDEPRWPHKSLTVVGGLHSRRGPYWKEYNIYVKIASYCNAHRNLSNKDFYVFHDDNFLLRIW